MAKQELQTFKILKSIAKNDEKLALQKAVEKTGLGTRFLKAQHTDKMFVFVQIR